MTTTTNVTTNLLRDIVIGFNNCVGDRRCAREEEKQVKNDVDKANEMLDAWDRAVEEVMTMLADVPGDDMVSKVKKLKDWYQDLYNEMDHSRDPEVRRL